jgi:hypothetical protein
VQVLKVPGNQKSFFLSFHLIPGPAWLTVTFSLTFNKLYYLPYYIHVSCLEHKELENLLIRDYTSLPQFDFWTRQWRICWGLESSAKYRATSCCFSTSSGQVLSSPSPGPPCNHCYPPCSASWQLHCTTGWLDTGEPCPGTEVTTSLRVTCGGGSIWLSSSLVWKRHVGPVTGGKGQPNRHKSQVP